MTERFHSSYPHYDVMAKRDGPSWNEATRRALAARLTEVPPRRFLSEAEWTTLAAVCDRVLPQPERAEPVPIVPWIDAALHENRGNGTRYADLPPLRECWRRGLAALDAEAEMRHGRAFSRLDPADQDAILADMDSGKVRAPAWEALPARRFFRQVVLTTVVEIYYAHPDAWNEIGFGGPAAPRGYVRLGMDRRDPWEAEEEDRRIVAEARGS